jgi:leader peptidase (prepilin peptidase)/N-methyltransferase
MVATGTWIAVLGAVACERARAYQVACPAKDPRSYLMVALAIAVCAWAERAGFATASTPGVLAVAAVAAITDVLSGYVFDRVLIAGACAAAVTGAIQGHAVDAAAGAAAGAAAVGIPWIATLGRGIGAADVKFAAVLGCGLGVHGALEAVWYGFVTGAVAAAAAMLIGRRGIGSAMPFAPFLALGSALWVGGVAW